MKMQRIQRIWPVVVVGFSMILSVLADHHLEKDKKTQTGQRLFEMRTYYTHEGKLKDLHQRFREHTNAIFVKHGMTLVGFWTPEDKEGTLVYILAYPSKKARQAAWKAFASDPAWKKAFAESRKDGPLVKKVESVFMQATDYSPLQ